MTSRKFENFLTPLAPLKCLFYFGLYTKYHKIGNSCLCDVICEHSLIQIGRLSKEHMHRLFQNLFPNGDSLPFINAIYRIFSHKQCNEYLDFQEFLTAINVTTLRSEEEKLKVQGKGGHDPAYYSIHV